MMKKNLVAASFLMFLLHPSFITPQGDTADAQVRELLPRLQKGTCEDRSRIFYDLMQLGRSNITYGSQGYWITVATSRLLKLAPSMAEKMRLTLIRALEYENLRHQRAIRAHAVGAFSEECTDYYGDLIGAVASLKDERSVNAALGAITMGKMATNILLEFREKSLNPVLEKLKSDDPEVRASATFVLSEMVQDFQTDKFTKALDKPSVERIRKGLLLAAHDEKFYVRRHALEGLSALGDPESVRELERLALSDPYHDSSEKVGEQYPVREAAKQALIKLGRWRKPETE